jgi:outer membrane protein assembly factor BamB
MNKYALLFFVSLLATLSFGQQKMPVLWETKIEHPIVYTGTGSEERGIGFVASDEEITVFDNYSGHTIWSKKYININSGLIDIDDLICFWEADALILISGKGKTSKLVCVDIEDGILLWQIDGLQRVNENTLKYISDLKVYAYSQAEGIYFIDAFSGHQVFHLNNIPGAIGSWIYDKKDQTLVIVNMDTEDNKPRSDFKNLIVKVDLLSGKVIWENTFEGKAQLELMTMDPAFQLSRINEKIILSLEGLQIFDYLSGQLDRASPYLCSTYKLCTKPNGVKKFGVYNYVAFPTIEDNSVYAFTQKEENGAQLIKYNLNTKKVQWSVDLGKARALPKMDLLSGKLLIQNGGAIENQAYVVEKSGDYFIYKWLRSHPLIEPSGLFAINSNDGEIIWELDYPGSITNTLLIENIVYVGSKNAVLSININDGSIVNKFINDSVSIGDIKLIHQHGENIVIAIGQTGISAFNIETGKRLYSSAYKELSLAEFNGSFIVMKGQKDEMVVFDAESGHYKFNKSKSTELSTLSPNGKYLYVYGKKSVRKLRAN